MEGRIAPFRFRAQDWPEAPEAEHGQEAGGHIAPAVGAVNRAGMQKTPGQAGKNGAVGVP
jgi:hypothetical protein